MNPGSDIDAKGNLTFFAFFGRLCATWVRACLGRHPETPAL